MLKCARVGEPVSSYVFARRRQTKRARVVAYYCLAISQKISAQCMPLVHT